MHLRHKTFVLLVLAFWYLMTIIVVSEYCFEYSIYLDKALLLHLIFNLMGLCQGLFRTYFCG